MAFRTANIPFPSGPTERATMMLAVPSRRYPSHRVRTVTDVFFSDPKGFLHKTNAACSLCALGDQDPPKDMMALK